MKIIVISLQSNIERRTSVKQALQEHQLEFEFLDAVDGRLDKHPYLERYDEAEFILNRRRKAAPGELGCYASHMLAWERCIALNEPVMVLEDDFEFTADFKEGLEFLAPFIETKSYIRLEKIKTPLRFNAARLGQFTLAQQLKVAQCMTGYIIHPQAAKIFLHKSSIMSYPVDVFLRNTSLHQLPLYAITPHLVQPSAQFTTTIGQGVRAERIDDMELSVLRFMRKWTRAFKNAWVNIRNFLCSMC